MRYYIVYNIDKIVFHYGILLDNEFLTTGLEQTFITEDKLLFIDKLKNDFNVDYSEDIPNIMPNYIEENIQQNIQENIQDFISKYIEENKQDLEPNWRWEDYMINN
jgi:hypothetical protein